MGTHLRVLGKSYPISTTMRGFRWTLPILRLLSSKVQGRKDFWKPSKPCHVGIHWKALAECSQMSTHLPGFQSFLRLFASFCIDQIRHQQHKDNFPCSLLRYHSLNPLTLTARVVHQYTVPRPYHTPWPSCYNAWLPSWGPTKAGWPGGYVKVQRCGGLSMVLLQLKDPLELFGKRRVPGFYAVAIWT